MHIQVVDKPEHDVCPISAPELSDDFIGVCFVQSRFMQCFPDHCHGCRSHGNCPPFVLPQHPSQVTIITGFVLRNLQVSVQWFLDHCHGCRSHEQYIKVRFKNTKFIQVFIILAIVFRSFGFLTDNNVYIIWLSNSLSVLNEGYSRNVH